MWLIDAVDLVETVKYRAAHAKSPEEKDAYMQVLWDISQAPTIEAEPVRHGRWIVVYPWRGSSQTTLMCSACKTCQPVGAHLETPGCPYCRAIMDGGDNNGSNP